MGCIFGEMAGVIRAISIMTIETDTASCIKLTDKFTIKDFGAMVWLHRKKNTVIVNN